MELLGVGIGHQGVSQSMNDEARTLYVLDRFLGLEAFTNEVPKHVGGKARGCGIRIDGLLLGEEVRAQQVNSKRSYRQEWRHQNKAGDSLRLREIF